jgi:hypothetical protein
MTKTEADQAIADAERAGIDVNLIELSLALTPEERWKRHDAALALATELRTAMLIRDDSVRPVTPAAR